MVNQTELKKSVEIIAIENGQTELEVITALQSAAAQTDNEELLDALCELKWDYIG